MMRTRMWALALAAVATLVTAQAAQAAVSVGDKAPDWKGIVGIDDAKHALADYAEAKAIVLVFTCNHCPVAKAYEDRLVALQKDYQDKGVQVIAVNVNNLPADRLDKMKERAEEQGFNFPYLYDETQKIGRDYGADVTPHVFVLNQDRKIVFVGPLDNNMNEKKAQKHFVRDVLDAVLAGKKPAVSEEKPHGCKIKYD